MTNRRFRSMPRQDARDWLKGKDFFSNAFEQKWTIAAGQIPAPHTLAEENIARHEQPLLWKIKT